MAAERIIVDDGFRTIREVLAHEKSTLLSDRDSFWDLKRKPGDALSLVDSNFLAHKARSATCERYSWVVRARRMCDSVGAVPRSL